MSFKLIGDFSFPSINVVCPGCNIGFVIGAIPYPKTNFSSSSSSSSCIIDPYLPIDKQIYPICFENYDEDSQIVKKCKIIKIKENNKYEKTFEVFDCQCTVNSNKMHYSCLKDWIDNQKKNPEIGNFFDIFIQQNKE